MIKHIVFWKLKENAAGKSRIENAEKVKQLLEALNGKIPGMKTLEVGIDFSLMYSSFDIALYSVFESKKHLLDYQNHPEHTVLKPFVSEVTSQRAMVDYELSGS